MLSRKKRIPYILLLLLCSACHREPSATSGAIRLLDLYKPQEIENQQASEKVPRTEFRFDTSQSFQWEAGPGVADLKIVDGKLTGRSTTEFPILHFQRTEGLNDRDTLYTTEIKMRAS